MEGAPILHLRATSKPLTAWEGFGADRMWRKGKRKAAHWPPSLPLCLQPRFPSSRACFFCSPFSALMCLRHDSDLRLPAENRPRLPIPHGTRILHWHLSLCILRAPLCCAPGHSLQPAPPTHRRHPCTSFLARQPNPNVPQDSTCLMAPAARSRQASALKPPGIGGLGGMVYHWQIVCPYSLGSSYFITETRFPGEGNMSHLFYVPALILSLK